MQIIARIILSLIIGYLGFLSLKIVWTKEIDWQYPLKWIRTKVENSIPTVTSPINISPSRIPLKTGRWKGISSFNIYNNSAETLYNIYLKVELENLEMSSQDIEIIPKNESDFIKGQLSNISANFDIVKILGTDSKGKNCILMIIYSLLPHESKPFKIDANKVPNSELEQANIIISLIKYSKEPVQVLSQGKGKVAFPFELAESFTVKGVSFYLKKPK